MRLHNYPFRVLDLLASAPGTESWIAYELGAEDAARGTINSTLLRLRRRGLVKTVGDAHPNVYAPTAKGIMVIYGRGSEE